MHVQVRDSTIYNIMYGAICNNNNIMNLGAPANSVMSALGDPISVNYDRAKECSCHAILKYYTL